MGRLAGGVMRFFADQQFELLLHAGELLLLLVDLPGQRVDLRGDRIGLRGDGLQLLFGGEFAPHQIAGEIVFLRAEANIEFFVEGVERRPAGRGRLVELRGFVLQQFQSLSILIQRELHFAHRLLELQVGFLDSVEHRMKVGLKQPRESGYQCHG